MAQECSGGTICGTCGTKSPSAQKEGKEKGRKKGKRKGEGKFGLSATAGTAALLRRNRVKTLILKDEIAKATKFSVI